MNMMEERKKYLMGDNFIQVSDEAINDTICDAFVDFINEAEKVNHTERYEKSLESPHEQFNLLNLRFNFDKNIDYRYEAPSESVNIQEYFYDLHFFENEIYKYFTEYIKYYNTAFTQYTEALQNDIPIFLSAHNGINSIDLSTLVGPTAKVFKKSTDGIDIWMQDWSSAFDVASKRMLSCVTFLNDVEEGGELEFFNQKIKIIPEKGRVVIWPSYFTHIYKHHIPISSDKYIVEMFAIPSI